MTEPLLFGLGKIAIFGSTMEAGQMTASDNRRDPHGGPIARILAEGEGWCASEYVRTASPADRPFEERHEWVAIAAVLEGSFNYKTDTGQAVLHPGSFLSGNPGSCYECGHDHSRGDRCIAFLAEPTYFADAAAGIAGSSRFKFPSAMLAAIPKILPWFAYIEAGMAVRYRIEIESTVPRLAETVITHVSGELARPVRVSPRDERRLSAVLHYIKTHATDDIDLDSLADQAAMSKYHFVRVFRCMVGVTPYQFLLSVRMRSAAVRLAMSSEPVSAIAFDVGFNDLSTFNGRFREVFGMTPSVYRNRERP